MIISEQDLKIQTESIATNVYEKYLKKGDVVYDIGAFKGVLSLAFANLGYEVYAIEASERNYYDLVSNTSSNKNITTILAALHEKDLGEVVTRFNDCIGSEHPSQKITYYSYDSLVKCFNLPPPRFIKMDIEGMESVVFKNFDTVLKSIRPLI